ncbi:MAG: diaminopimelate decarboxylase family protein [Gemmatimonadales bacterium]
MVSQTRNEPPGISGRPSGGAPAEIRRLPLAFWGLRAGQDGLELAGQAVSSLADRFGTPCYLFDETRLRRNIRDACRAAQAALRGADLHYSFKTNPVPRVAAIAREEGLGAEVISGRELRAALAAGFAAERVIFNGPGKRDADLAFAVEHGVLVQVESASEARALARIAADGRRARAGLRINPDAYDPRANAATRMGARASVFGMDPASAEFDEAVTVLSAADRVTIESVSACIGTGIIDTAPFARMARALADVRARLAARGIEIRTLDGGGGFAVPSEVRYADGGVDALAAGNPVALPAPDEIATFAEVCRAIAAELGPEPPERLVLEPGRLLVADAFHLVARVIRLKESGGQRFAILDAGRTQNAMFVARGHHEMVLVREPDAPHDARYTVVGPLCASFDTYAHGRALPELQESDLIAVLDVGAYNLSAQSRWCFEPAPVVALADGGASLVPTHA